MTFNDYQKSARATAIYPNVGSNYIYPTLGLCGETGEIAEKVKKIIRDKEGVVTPASLIALNQELGDVLWYIANLASELGITLDDIAKDNIKKLYDRKNRDVIKGDGDNR